MSILYSKKCFKAYETGLNPLCQVYKLLWFFELNVFVNSLVSNKLNNTFVTLQIFINRCIL